MASAGVGSIGPVDKFRLKFNASHAPWAVPSAGEILNVPRRVTEMEVQCGVNVAVFADSGNDKQAPRSYAGSDDGTLCPSVHLAADPIKLAANHISAKTATLLNGLLWHSCRECF